jgi:hypothetical protein
MKREELELIGKKIIELEKEYTYQRDKTLSQIEKQITQLVENLSLEDMLELDEYISNNILKI